MNMDKEKILCSKNQAIRQVRRTGMKLPRTGAKNIAKEYCGYYFCFRSPPLNEKFSKIKAVKEQRSRCPYQ